MPQIGTEQKPIRMSPKRRKTLSGTFYTGENKKKYDSNYDRIFGKKEKKNER